MKDCIFCKIVKKETKTNLVFENELCLAFTPLDPISKGHLILIPKAHFKDIFDIDKEVLSALVLTAKEIALKIVKDNNATGINLLNASRKDAQQSVFHFHIHLIPRYPNDGLDLWLKNKL